MEFNFLILILSFIFGYWAKNHIDYITSEDFITKFNLYMTIQLYIIHYPVYKVYKGDPGLISPAFRSAYENTKVQDLMSRIESMSNKTLREILDGQKLYRLGFTNKIDNLYTWFSDYSDIPIPPSLSNIVRPEVKEKIDEYFISIYKVEHGD